MVNHPNRKTKKTKLQRLDQLLIASEQRLATRTNIYARWLADNALEDTVASRADWNAMIERNEKYIGA